MKTLAIALAVTAAALFDGSAANAAENTVKATLRGRIMAAAMAGRTMAAAMVMAVRV